MAMSHQLGSIPVTTATVGTSAHLGRRLMGAGGAAGAVTVLLVAAFLTPSSAGVGTHEQLMLPPCQWISVMYLPCPTCGMTTSFAHAADGRFVSSFLTQPMGCLLALVTAMGVFIGTYVAATGSPLVGMLGRYFGPRLGWIAAGLFVAAWIYKILSHKGLL